MATSSLMSHNEQESPQMVKQPSFVRELKTAVTHLEIESKQAVDGFASPGSCARINTAAQKMKQLIDTKSEYENGGEALLSWNAILRLRDFLAKTIKNRLLKAESQASSNGVWLSTSAKSQFQTCMPMVEDDLMRILLAKMSAVETGCVKSIFNSLLQLELALLDSTSARNQPTVDMAQQSSSPWNPSNIIFTTDFDVTCTVVDSSDALVKAADVAAQKSAGDYRPGKLLEDYDAAMRRHSIHTTYLLTSLENSRVPEVSARLSGRSENSDDVVPGMDPSLKPSFESVRTTSSALSRENPTDVPFDEAGLRKALTKLSDLEVICNQDVVTAGVLTGFTKNQLMEEAKLVELRPFCAEVLKKLGQIGTVTHVVSANWSRDLIKGGLPDLPEDKLFVYCNNMIYNASGVSTGKIDNTLVDAFDKEQVIRAIRTLSSHSEAKNADTQVGCAPQAAGSSGKMLVYMGDSHTDLLGLLEADLGIVIGASSSCRMVMALYGITLVPLPEATEALSLARLNGSEQSWRRSGILFEALGWDKIEACLFGVASDLPKQSDDISSEKQALQHETRSDTTDLSQGRHAQANLEVVEVAC